jgi:hypothetical protein
MLEHNLQATAYFRLGRHPVTDGYSVVGSLAARAEALFRLRLQE